MRFPTTCPYCWATFTPVRNEVGCSKPCSQRMSAWNTWVTASRKAAVKGRKCSALPPGGASLVAATARFARNTELDLGVAA